MRIGRVLAAICLSFSLLCSASAFALPQTAASSAEAVPDDVSGAFESAILIDLTADAVLYEKDAARGFSPTGSAVTLMNAHIVAESVDLDEEITISTDFSVLARDSRRIALAPGEKWRVEDLIAAMLLYGAQDAALVLAEYVHTTSESFTFVMNQAARSLGMEDTVYYNPFGSYDERQTTTAHDLMLLAEEVYKNETLREMLSASAYSPSGHNRIDNRLRLLQSGSSSYDPRVTGMGMGTTSLSGTNVIVSAEDGGRTILLTGYSTSTDQAACETGAKGWLDYAFNEFRTADCVEVASLAAQNGVLLGNETVLGCVLREDRLPVTAGRTLADSIEELAEGFTLLADGPPDGEILWATLLYGETAVRNVTLTLPVDAGIPALTVPDGAEEAQPTETARSASDVPFYTSEEWQPPKQSGIAGFAWLFIILGAAAGCAGAYFVLNYVRKIIR